MIEGKRSHWCGCSHPALQVRNGLPLRPISGERDAMRLAGSAWHNDLTVWLLSYRLITAAFMIGILGWSIASVPDPTAKWLIFLTHWGILAVAAHFIVACTLVFYLKFSGHPDHNDGLHWSSQIYWSVYNVAAPTAFMISIFYWALLYGSDFDDALQDDHEETITTTENILDAESEINSAGIALNVMVHAVNSVLMFIEVLLVALPSRLVLFYQPLIFGLSYVLFNIIYYLAGGTDYIGNQFVYAMVDWSNVGSTSLVVFLTSLLLAVMHAFTVALAVVRDKVADRYVQETKIDKKIGGHYNKGYKHDV